MRFMRFFSQMLDWAVRPRFNGFRERASATSRTQRDTAPGGRRPKPGNQTRHEEQQQRHRSKQLIHRFRKMSRPVPGLFPIHQERPGGRIR
jgi:hypothetical protein